MLLGNSDIRTISSIPKININNKTNTKTPCILIYFYLFLKAEGKKPKKCHLKREISELRKKQNFQIKNKSTRGLQMMSVQKCGRIIDINH